MKLKIYFVDFWPDFNPNDNFLRNLLAEYFEIEVTTEPDILFFSVFGENHKRYDCLKIFYTGENYKPSRFDAHFSISFYEQSDRNIRFPIYLFYHDLSKLLIKRKAADIFIEKKKFCCFIVSNQACKTRNTFFKKLSSYKKVDSGGKYLNNIGYSVPDKHAFIKDYKFTICFENLSVPGYTTEKIVEAMYGECVPIYWGNPSVHEEFNHKSFINVHDYKNMNEVIEHIIYLDRDAEAYIKLLGEPWLINNEINPVYTNTYLIEKISEVFHQYKENPSLFKLSKPALIDRWIDRLQRKLRGERRYHK